MATKKTTRVSTGQGFCCPHCADSKFPCVRMEAQMRQGEEQKKPEPDKKKES